MPQKPSFPLDLDLTSPLDEDPLACFDFSSTDTSAAYGPPTPPPDDGGLVKRIEAAAHAGDLAAVQDLIARLRGPPEGQSWIEGTHDTQSGSGRSARPYGRDNTPLNAIERDMATSWLSFSSRGQFKGLTRPARARAARYGYA